MADNDTTDLSKTHVNKAEQMIKVNFYLRLQNTDNLALSASSLHVIARFNSWRILNTAGIPAKCDKTSSRRTRMM